MNNLEELEKKRNELIEMMEKEKKKREIEKKKYEEYKKLELKERQIYSEHLRLEEERRKKEIEKIKKEKEKEWRERGFNCIGCQRYFQQQREESYIEDLVNRTLNGEFGSGAKKRAILGSMYPVVQKRINERLGISKKH